MDPTMANEGMGTTPEYELAVVVLSAQGVVLAVLYLARTVRSYRISTTKRAAVALAKGVGLAVISVGLLISAAGLPAGSAMLSIAGLSVARGAFIVLVTTLVLADVRPRGNRPD